MILRVTYGMGMELKIDGDEGRFLACYSVLKVVAFEFRERGGSKHFMGDQKRAAVYHLFLEWETASSPR